MHFFPLGVRFLLDSFFCFARGNPIPPRNVLLWFLFVLFSSSMQGGRQGRQIKTGRYLHKWQQKQKNGGNRKITHKKRFFFCNNDSFFCIFCYFLRFPPFFFVGFCSPRTHTHTHNTTKPSPQIKKKSVVYGYIYIYNLLLKQFVIALSAASTPRQISWAVGSLPEQSSVPIQSLPFGTNAFAQNACGYWIETACLIDQYARFPPGTRCAARWSLFFWFFLFFFFFGFALGICEH